MELILSTEKIERYKKLLAVAEPYDDDDPEYNTLDGDVDIDRANAAIAKELLTEHYGTDDRSKWN